MHPNVQIGSLKLDSLYDIASNKAHTIGRRGEWKDYVDIYFLLSKENLDIQKIINETEKRFGAEFDEKLFWEQLVYWGDLQDFDINFIDKTVSKEKIQNYFKKLTKSKFRK